MSVENSGMPLAVALEREHQQIDSGLESFLSGLAGGQVDTGGLDTALECLRRHIYLEERILFPPIRHGGMAMPVAVMMSEHGQIWRAMDALAEAAAGEDLDLIAVTCRQLLGRLAEHNAKEEGVIYPAADTGLEPDKAAELADFIENGLMPDCWECLEAG